MAEWTRLLSPLEMIMPRDSQHPETIVLHAGYRSDPTASYQFRNTARAADLFGLAELGNISIGIEHEDDIIADLAQALAAA
jgi:O-acetylhomoserine/O-acetylserine sulfhydrylase-like pyridoxal-dependent enzyme